jgi:hypothetical protein
MVNALLVPNTVGLVMHEPKALIKMQDRNLRMGGQSHPCALSGFLNCMLYQKSTITTLSTLLDYSKTADKTWPFGRLWGDESVHANGLVIFIQAIVPRGGIEFVYFILQGAFLFVAKNGIPDQVRPRREGWIREVHATDAFLDSPSHLEDRRVRR